MSRFTEAYVSLDAAVRRGVRQVLLTSPLLVLSLGLATVLWAYVTHQENPTLQHSLPAYKLASFDPENVPKSMLVTQESPDTVTVTLIGTRDAVTAISSADVALHVDLNGLDTNSPGTYPVPVKATVNKHGHRGVRVELDPDTVRVTLEQVARRTVPIKVNVTDSPPVGFELGGVPTTDPPEAVVSGLKQNVDAVEAAYADLKLTGLSVSTTVSLQLNPRNSDSRTISGVTVQPAAAAVKVPITRTLYTREAFIAVHTHGSPAPGYVATEEHANPPTVTIRGSLDALNAVTTIPTDDVELEGATRDVQRVVALRLPPGVTVVRGPGLLPATPASGNAPPIADTVVATVSIAPEHAPGSVAVAPRVVGLPAGDTVQLGTPFVVVSFNGLEPQILALRPGDVGATLDLSNLAPGSYSLEPKITLPSGLERDAVTPPKVDVTILAPPTVTPPPTPPPH